MALFLNALQSRLPQNPEEEVRAKLAEFFNQAKQIPGFAQKAASQPLPSQLSAPAKALEGFQNTSNPLVTMPAQFGSGLIQGQNLGLGKPAYRGPRTTAESGAFMAGSFAGAMNPKSVTQRVIKPFIAATNPIARKLVSPFAQKAIGGKVASAGANIAQGIALDTAMQQPTTPLSVGIDAVTGLAFGPSQFDEPIKMAARGAMPDLGAKPKSQTVGTTPDAFKYAETQADNLLQEAKKHKSAEEFTRAIASEGRTGQYFHLTDNPNFEIKKGVVPRDLVSTQGGRGIESGLMVTSDVNKATNDAINFPERKWVAIIDTSNADIKDLPAVGRGFNEFFVSGNNLDKISVQKVVPYEEALKLMQKSENRLRDMTKSQLIDIWNQANKGSSDPSKIAMDSISSRHKAETSSRLQEAKKHKSAEEFIKSKGLNFVKEVDGGEKRIVIDLFPTDDIIGKGVTKSETINALKNSYKNGHKIIEPSNGLWTKQGYSFINGLVNEGFIKKANNRGGIERFEILPNIKQVKTESPLTDIWNQANKADNLLQEAKGKSLDEFLRGQESRLYHGSPTGEFGSKEVHIGTKEAAKQALEARIGIPANGKGWDGTTNYGDTLLAGKKTLRKLDSKGYNQTGFNVDVPESDFYLKDHPELAKATFGDGTKIPLSVKPNLFGVKLKGEMTNLPTSAMSDIKANATIKAMLKKGTAKRGYYYTNIGEDAGSISAVVPSKTHLERNLTKSQLIDIWNQANKGSSDPSKIAMDSISSRQKAETSK